VLKLDAGKVIAENSQLHVQLVQQAEQYDTREKDHYKHVKRLEDREAELSYWKHQAIDRFQKVERENSELKKRLEQLLKLAEKRSQGVAACCCLCFSCNGGCSGTVTRPVFDR
jgi:hypothetical protein